MRRRCRDKNRRDYKHYGAKGIGVCREWEFAEEFIAWAELAGYKKGLILDRIDNSKGYSPDNCRFVDILASNRNKTNVLMNPEKAENVRSLLRSGKSRTEVANLYGVNYSVIVYIDKGRTWKSSAREVV